MKVTKEKTDDALLLKINGRIDAQWADHFSLEIEDAIRNGHHDIHLDMHDVSFMSSAGVRVLITSCKRLREISGSLLIINPSEAVNTLLVMSGLMEMFQTRASTAGARVDDTSKVTKGETEFEVFTPEPENKMSYSVIGNPELLSGKNSEAAESTRIAIQKSTLAIGLGAFGPDHDSCKDLFGEFVAVSGSAAYLPPAAAGTPDYMLTTGSFVPEMQMLYAAVCEGSFSNFLRFETPDDSTGATLSHLTGSLLEISGHKRAAVVMIAESAGLIGASLRKSPTELDPKESIFTYPDIRKWLSFSPERVFDRSLVVVVGIASSGTESEDSFLRAPSEDSSCTGHFHAAAFSYAPIARDTLSLDETLKSIFEKETLQGVIHLLADNRDNTATLESEFKRGAIWIGGIE